MNYFMKKFITKLFIKYFFCIFLLAILPNFFWISIISSMCATETLPLTMEPQSGLYRDPVIVLDFQSLYPSIIIAYNYCFTTCLGKFSSIKNCFQNRSNQSSERIILGGLPYFLPVSCKNVM